MTPPAPPKAAFLNLAHWLFRAILLLPISPAFGAPPPPVATQWPGVTLAVHQIARLPDNRVSIIFIYRASPRAPDTFIAGAPLQKSGDGPPEYLPYSLEAKGELMDEATGERFSAAEAKAGDAVNPGQTVARTVIRANEGIFLGGIFKCPPINQDNPPKPQSVSFQLPDLKTPIKGIPLPREENVPLNFFPKPRLFPPEPAKPAN